MKKLICAFCVAVAAGLARDIFAAPMVRIGDREFSVLNSNNADDPNAVSRNWKDGDTVVSMMDIYDFYFADRSTVWGPTGENINFDIGEGSQIVWDFDGYNYFFHETFLYARSGNIIFRNGTMYNLVSGSGAHVFDWNGSNIRITLEDDFSVVRSVPAGMIKPDSDEEGGIGVGGRIICVNNTGVTNSFVVVDGAYWESQAFFDFDAVGDGCAIIVKGASVIKIDQWAGWSWGPESFQVRFEGGWWSLDPFTCARRHMSESCTVFDFGENFALAGVPARYRVLDCEAGWTFDSRRDFGLVLPAGEINSPGQPIAVELRGGGVLEDRVMLADLSNVTVNGDSLEFVSANPKVKISYRDGKLYAQPASIGMIIIVR